MFAAEYEIQCTGLIIGVFFQIICCNVYYVDVLHFLSVYWIMVPVGRCKIMWECFLLEAGILGVECGLNDC